MHVSVAVHGDNLGWKTQNWKMVPILCRETDGGFSEKQQERH